MRFVLNIFASLGGSLQCSNLTSTISCDGMQETVLKEADVCYICHRKHGVCIKVRATINFFFVVISILDCKGFFAIKFIDS